MEKNEFTVSQVCDRAWELTKKHGLVIAVVLFVVSVITQTISMLGFPTGTYMSALTAGDIDALVEVTNGLNSFSITSLFAGILNMVLSAGLLNCVIKLTSGEMKNFELSGFKMPINTYVYFFLANIVLVLIIFFGIMLCIIPGIILGVRLIFVLPYILTHPEAGFGDAFKQSWEMTKGHFWDLLGLGLLYGIFCFLGLLCCCIGVYFAAAMGYFMLCVAYSMLSNDPVACEEAKVD